MHSLRSTRTRAAVVLSLVIAVLPGCKGAPPESKTAACGASATPFTSDTVINLVFLDAPEFKEGVLRIREDVQASPADDFGLHAVWQTSLEAYLRGIAEVPDSWGDVAPAVLEANLCLVAECSGLDGQAWRPVVTRLAGLLEA